jgi:hypothetical protein
MGGATLRTKLALQLGWCSLRIHQTNPVEPQKTRNIAYLLSLSARAMNTREEKFHD